MNDMLFVRQNFHKILAMGSGRVRLGWVSHFWFEFKFGKFPLKMSNFFPSNKKIIFGSGQKVPGSKGGRPLIYCRSKVSSGRVGSGQGSSLQNTTALKVE